MYLVRSIVHHTLICQTTQIINTKMSDVSSVTTSVVIERRTTLPLSICVEIETRSPLIAPIYDFTRTDVLFLCTIILLIKKQIRFGEYYLMIQIESGIYLVEAAGSFLMSFND